MQNKKNGCIELFRFIFCIIILIHHVSLDILGRDYLFLCIGGGLQIRRIKC